MDVGILLTVEVDCLLPRHGGASIQSRAYSNSDEIGIRPDIPVEAVRVWPADPLGRRDGCEPDPQCFRSKIDTHVAKTLESKPTLVQISYSSRLPCNGQLHILP